MLTHVLSILLYYLNSRWLKSENYKVLGSMTLVANTFLQVASVLSVQEGYFELNICLPRDQDASKIRVLFLYEILTFLFNILSMVVFLLLAWITSYRTIRERIGLAHQSGPLCRKESDYFIYCYLDVHYFSSWFTIFCLTMTAAGEVLVHGQIGIFNIRASFGCVLVIHLIYAY